MNNFTQHFFLDQWEKKNEQTHVSLNNICNKKNKKQYLIKHYQFNVTSSSSNSSSALSSISNIVAQHFNNSKNSTSSGFNLLRRLSAKIKPAFENNRLAPILCCPLLGGH